MTLKLILFAVLAITSAEDSSRVARSLQPGAPNVNIGNKDQPWQVDPNVSRDDRGNTRTDINIKHHGDNHDVQAGWSKVVRGPDRAKPTWHVGGSYRWRRSLQPGAPNVNVRNTDQPWKVDPSLSRDDNGNTRADINIKHQGDKHDVQAGWSKVIRGPGRAKPTWHVGGTYRWRRSLQPGAPNVNVGNKDQPWKVDPSLSKDDNGNTRADISIKHKGDKHDVQAGWSKVIRGPGRAKPTWHVGGTYRWRRSLQPGAPNVNVGNKDQPWKVDPSLSKDDNGNTRADINIKHKGDKHDVQAGWSKIIRGPGRAKPTWHVGGTYRWRRSLQPGAPNVNVGNKDQPWKVDPSLSKDDNGNTRADINIKHQGDKHDVQAGWSKVIRGPGRAKPTWHVGGTYRWRRSLQPGAPTINIGNKDQPWQFDPNVSKDDRGNTRTDVNIKHHGPSHDVQAGWSKVVRGPDRAKPTWHVGGSFRW